MENKNFCNMCLLILVVMAVFNTANASAPIRVDSTYEDSVRIAIIWNDATGACDSVTQPVGEKTLAFTVRSIDTSKVHNVKTLKNTTSLKVTWNDIVSLWGEEKLPHVIAHVNAGWSVDWNGPELDTIFSNAVKNKIGIVSIGDDAASLATTTFGFDSIENAPAPLGDATFVDSLWIGLNRENDEKLKIYAMENRLQYPGLNGIISNAVDSILKSNILHFYRFGSGRCQADADKYNILYPQWITMLGYQQGNDEGVDLNGPNELNVLVAIQDTLQKKLIRRAVSLSFQPQFLSDSVAAEQIVYDALMFSSLTHTLSVASKLYLKVSSDTLKAGESVNITAELYDQYNERMDDKLGLVNWKIMDGAGGDSLGLLTGGETNIFATKAWRTVTVQASFYDPETGATVNTLAAVYVKPGDPHHVDISKDSVVSESELNVDEPAMSVSFTRADSDTQAYVLVRDKYSNFVKLADDTVNWTSGDTNVVRALNDGVIASRGSLIKAEGGQTAVTAQMKGLISDSIDVTVEDNSFVEKAITRDSDGNGYIDMIELHFDAPVIIADLPGLTTGLTVTYGAKNFVIKQITTENKNLDSVVFVKVNEDSSDGLQTAIICNISGVIPVYTNAVKDVYNVNVSRNTLDGVGPVLKSATYYFNADRMQKDTLILVLSEPLTRRTFDTVSPGAAFVYYCSVNSMKETPLLQNAVLSVPASASAYTDTVKIALDMNIIKQYGITDSTDLMQLVDIGIDAAGNLAPSKAISRKTAVDAVYNNAVSAAFTRDSDGNGYIDIIELHLGGSLVNIDRSGNYATGIAVSGDSKAFQVTDVVTRSGMADTVVYVKVKEDTSGGLETSLTCNVSGKISVISGDGANSYNVNVNIVALDGVGPVLKRAVYFYNDNSALGDTLKLVLSEPADREILLNNTPEKVFVYYCYKNSMKETEMLKNSKFIIPGTARYTDTVKIALDMNIVRQYGFTEKADMMQLVDFGRDSSGNYSPSKAISRKVPLESSGVNDIIVSVYPNPFSFSKITLSTLPPEIRSVYKDVIGGKASGILVTVKAKKNLRMIDGSYGRVRIYDALGNLVAKGIPLLQLNNMNDYAFIWDGTNEKSRRVGAGTYLLVINVVDNSDGTRMVDKRKIGIVAD